ncbi:MAG: ABC transporter permease [Planctomycetales bacterium]|nr:ABC transporter permease [Planctomycetales bacterium]
MKTARFRLLFDNDTWWSFTGSSVTMLAAAVALLWVLLAIFAPLFAPHDPYDLTTLQLFDAFKPPVWMAGGDPAYLLGTDDQGRDLISAIYYGARTSLLVGVAAVMVSGGIGISLGLAAGFLGGPIDAIIMRAADVMLTFPSILVALLLDGLVRSVVSRGVHDDIAIYVVIFAIGFSSWPQFARTVRSSTMVEASKEYVLAARVIGMPGWRIMVGQVLPNVMGPVLVLLTLSLSFAILAEATLSFLGVGLPATEPSLGTLIRIGNDFLFSGEWWITIFPGAALATIVLSINLLGDWLRDVLDPKLR